MSKEIEFKYTGLFFFLYLNEIAAYYEDVADDYAFIFEGSNYIPLGLPSKENVLTIIPTRCLFNDNEGTIQDMLSDEESWLRYLYDNDIGIKTVIGTTFYSIQLTDILQKR